jgi:hypothetical protein
MIQNPQANSHIGRISLILLGQMSMVRGESKTCCRDFGALRSALKRA